MVTRSEIFLSCDLGKGVSCWWNLVFYPDMMCISARRSIGTDLKCGFASHSAFCGIMNYQFVSHVIQEKFELCLCLGTLRHVCGHCSRWHHHGLCYRLLPVSSGQVCTHWSLCLSSRLGIRSWSADGGQVSELDVPFKRSRDVKRVESKARTSSMSFPLFSFAAWRNFPALGPCLVSQKFWLNWGPSWRKTLWSQCRPWSTTPSGHTTISRGVYRYRLDCSIYSEHAVSGSRGCGVPMLWVAWKLV